MDFLNLDSVMTSANQLRTYAIKIPLVFVIILIGWLVIKYLRVLLARIFARSEVEQTLAQLVVALVGFIGWTVVLASIFSILGFDQIALAFSGSVAVLALGIAQGLKGIVNDLLSGLFLIADDDFRAGERIVIGGVEGEILSLDIRKTKIRDDSGNIHVIPNKNIDNGTYLMRPKNEE